MSLPVALAGVWLGAGIAAIVIVVRATSRALNRPLTEFDKYCTVVDEQIKQQEIERLVEERLRVIDERRESELADIEQEFSADVEAWLRSREEAA